jgi:hypothetical protein
MDNTTLSPELHFLEESSKKHNRFVFLLLVRTFEGWPAFQTKKPAAPVCMAGFYYRLQ